MENYYSNDSLTAFKVENGIVIEEKKKGSLKMLLVILGLGVLMLIGGFVLGLFGGTIGLAVAPFLIWGSALVLLVAIIAFILNMAASSDRTITFDTATNELTYRKKVIPFTTIEQLTYQEQAMMGKTMIFAFLLIGGKKKSLFSTAIVVSNPKEMIDFVQELNQVIQNGKSA